MAIFRRGESSLSKAYLLLEDGHIFEGESFGAEGETVGELVFTTGVVGYVETLSDPSYYGQIVMHTFPTLGDYGWIEEDMESEKSHMRGVVVREWCRHPSNFRAGVTIDEYLKQAGIPGVCGVDTRAITQIIREKGVMNAMITPVKPSGVPDKVKTYRVSGGVAATSVKRPEVHEPEGDVKAHVALLDYGAKHNILKELLQRGCRVTVLPQDTKAEDVLALKPDGVMLSNGPGDPADNVACVEEIKKLFGRLPIFGICLGHQLLALAAGGKTVKLKYGHRGANQPARETATGRVYITSQNHGYAVEGDLERMGAVISYVNLNDGSCEGLDYPGRKAFSLQFHPEAHCGPLDTEGAFDRFLRMMGGE
jgi:carbamoyl-phosphate synthase small subunit